MSRVDYICSSCRARNCAACVGSHCDHACPEPAPGTRPVSLDLVVRPSWDAYFLIIAREVAARGTCPRLRVGAVLVGPFRNLLATGYNGAPRGAPHADGSDLTGDPPEICRGCGAVQDKYGTSEHKNCTLYSGKGVVRVSGRSPRPDEPGCVVAHNHCLSCVHAEANAVAAAARAGTALNGAVAFTTHHPCPACYHLLVQAGVSRIAYAAPYENQYPEMKTLIERAQLRPVQHPTPLPAARL